MKKYNVAIVGLGFGAEFIPIYLKHPLANMYAICQRNAEKLQAIGDAYGIEKRYTDFEELIKDPAVDVVHINSPIHLHAEQTLKALLAGKHVACTVPMATSVEECKAIVEASRKMGKKYMMMETVVYSREFLYIKELYDKGELGKIQFLKASHQQEMDGWPDYWPGLPPMHYATHCVGPCLALQRKDAAEVSCFGSGRIREDLIGNYGSPFAIESAHVKLREEPVLHTAKKLEAEIPARVTVPDFAHLLPESIQRFTTGGVYDADDHQHLSFTQGGGHGGSHPHLVHEFVTALVEGRDPYPNARQSANWTCTGLLAHESALKGGVIMKLPEWSFSS